MPCAVIVSSLWCIENYIQHKLIHTIVNYKLHDDEKKKSNDSWREKNWIQAESIKITYEIMRLSQTMDEQK